MSAISADDNAASVSSRAAVAPRSLPEATTEPTWVKWVLIGVALAFLSLFLFVPLATVFVEAFKKGAGVYFAAITEPDALSAIKLTLIAAGVALPLNRASRAASSRCHAPF